MAPEDLLKSLKDLMDHTPINDRLPAFRGFKHLRSPCEQAILDVGFDLLMSGINLEPVPPVVVALIHGIRTSADWQEKARATLTKEVGVKVTPIGYGFFDLIRFIGPFRGEPIERVKIELRDLQRLHPKSELVVMAHSFGTYIVSKILQEAPDIRISRLLLCGSIIPTKYRWDQLSHHFTQQTLINEVGTNDFWPVFARVVTFGYGGSGSFGFKTARVFDRFFAYGHSDFFTEKHFEDFWKPFIVHGTVVNSQWDLQRPTPPWWISFLGGMPYIKIFIAAALGVLAFLGHYLYHALTVVWHLVLR